VGPESLKSLLHPDGKTRSAMPGATACAGPFANALCSFLSCRAEKTEVLSEDLLQVRSCAAGMTRAQSAHGCSGTHPWVLEAAAAPCRPVPQCLAAMRRAGRRRRVGSVGSGTISLPCALPALSQPGFQVSWNQIQADLHRDSNLIRLAGLRAPASPLSAVKPALGTGRVTAGDSPRR